MRRSLSMLGHCHPLTIIHTEHRPDANVRLEPVPQLSLGLQPPLLGHSSQRFCAEKLRLTGYAFQLRPASAALVPAAS